MVRVLLGIGTSGAYPSAMRLFRVQAERFDRPPPRVAMGVLSMTALSFSAVGPFFGGLLTNTFGWHAIFTVNIPLALLTIFLAILWTPKDDRPSEGLSRLTEEVDLVGIGLFTAFLVSLMIFLLHLNRPIWLALPVAAILCTWLIRHSLKRRQPFIDVHMLVRNRPLVTTYLRAGTMLMMVYCMLYGFAQWLESAVGYSGAKAGLITIPMSIVAAASSLMGTRTRSIRIPFLVSIGSALLGWAALLMVNSHTPARMIALAAIFFGAPQGMFSTATQTAIYIQAPPEEIGTAAGLQRTAQYVGAIAATSLLAVMFGQHATDHGLHSLAWVMAALSTILFITTAFDRTLTCQTPE